MIACQCYFGQISFQPTGNHNFEPYVATITGNGRIYYTTDGSEPTNNSPSEMNNVSINITKTTVLKAKLTTGQVYSRTFYYGPFPAKTVYFKAPTNWSSVCSFANSVDPQTTIDIWGPGNNMKPMCEGWYKSELAFFIGQVDFNNCLFPAPPPIYQYYSVVTEDTIFYDYSAGPITNPPACLLDVNDPSKKVAVVKIFPNPVQDYVNIESEKNFVSYEVVDTSGKLILNKDFKSNQIDIRNLKSGIYFIKLKSLNSETNIVKFIKK